MKDRGPTNDDGMTFREWLSEADAYISRACGLTLNDLPDSDSRSAWENCERPDDFACDALLDDGFPEDCLP